VAGGQICTRIWPHQRRNEHV